MRFDQIPVNNTKRPWLSKLFGGMPFPFLRRCLYKVRLLINNAFETLHNQTQREVQQLCFQNFATQILAKTERLVIVTSVYFPNWPSKITPKEYWTIMNRIANQSSFYLMYTSPISRNVCARCQFQERSYICGWTRFHRPAFFSYVTAIEHHLCALFRTFPLELTAIS